MMEIPTQFQIINPTAQNTMGGAHLHTPQSIFQHMMGQQNTSYESSSWTQPPPVPPMCMPWSITNVKQPHLVRFTGENKLPPCGSVIQQKRKLDVTDINTMRPTKQFITEEKMAAHFSDMHISTNYNSNSVPTISQSYNPQPSTSSLVELDVSANSGDLEDGDNMHPKLVISEELKRLQQEPLLPASLLSKIERPTMALVLWEPPTKLLKLFPSRSELQSQLPHIHIDDDNNNSNSNNNNAPIIESNQRVHDSNTFELQPMDV